MKNTVDYQAKYYTILTISALFSGIEWCDGFPAHYSSSLHGECYSPDQ